MQEIDDRSTGSRDSAPFAAAERVNDANTIRIPVLAEQLVVETTLVSHGAVRLHKGVTTEEQTLRVPVFHEEAVIEHLSPEALGPAATSSDPDVLIIPIYEEQVFVEKRMVLKEYIRVRKRLVEGERIVRDTVRREYVEVVGSEDTGNTATVPGERRGSGNDG